MTTNPDLVSIIIPTYNRAALLVEAVESALRQTWSSTEIIVVDDGSTDNTAECMAKFSEVKYLYQKNQGQASARNTGLRHAQGSYICSLDSDDLWEPDFLTECVSAIKKLGADFVFANWTQRDIEGKPYPSYFEKFNAWSKFDECDLPEWRVMDANQARTTYIDACISPSAAIVMRREVLLHGWTESFKVADDWCMLLDAVIEKPCRVAFTMKHLWVKRVVGDNIYDQRHYLELRRDFYIHDYRLIQKRFASLMKPRERALWHGRLAIHQFAMAKSEAKRRSIFSSVKHLTCSAVDLIKSRKYSADLASRSLEVIRGHGDDIFLS